MYTRTQFPTQAELGMGGAWDTVANIFKTGSDAYQAQKAAQAAQNAPPPGPVPQPSFLQRHGGKLVLAGVGLAAFLFIRSRRR